MTAILWKCRACCFRSRDVAAVRAHAAEPPGMFGAHVPYAPPTLAHAGMAWADLPVARDVEAGAVDSDGQVRTITGKEVA